jgi:hypothetical protein
MEYEYAHEAIDKNSMITNIFLPIYGILPENLFRLYN